MPGKRHSKEGYHGEVAASLPLSQIQQPRAILAPLHVPLHRDRRQKQGCRAQLCTVCARPDLGGAWGVSPALSRLVKPLVLVQVCVNPQGSFTQLSGKLCAGRRQGRSEHRCFSLLLPLTKLKPGCGQAEDCQEQPWGSWLTSPLVFVFLCVISTELTKIHFLYTFIAGVASMITDSGHLWPTDNCVLNLGQLVNTLSEVTLRTNPVWVQECHGGHLLPPQLSPQKGSFGRVGLSQGRLGSQGLLGQSEPMQSSRNRSQEELWAYCTQGPLSDSALEQ